MACTASKTPLLRAVAVSNANRISMNFRCEFRPPKACILCALCVAENYYVNVDVLRKHGRSKRFSSIDIPGPSYRIATV